MRETIVDIDWLAGVLGRSIENAGPYLHESFQMPDHCLSARQIAQHLQGSKGVALATVTARGEPRVAPMASLFYRGRFHIPTLRAAARARHVRKRPAVSLTYGEGVDLAIIVHGRAQVVAPDHAEFSVLEELLREASGAVVSDWGPGPLYLRVEPAAMFSFARFPERFPALEVGAG